MNRSRLGSAFVLAFVFSSPSFAWGPFSPWAKLGQPPQFCKNVRSTGAVVKGRVYLLDPNQTVCLPEAGMGCVTGGAEPVAIADNVTGRGKGVDLFVANRAGNSAIAFNITQNDFIPFIAISGRSDAHCQVQ